MTELLYRLRCPSHLDLLHLYWIICFVNNHIEMKWAQLPLLRKYLTPFSLYTHFLFDMETEKNSFCSLKYMLTFNQIHIFFKLTLLLSMIIIAKLTWCTSIHRKFWIASIGKKPEVSCSHCLQVYWKIWSSSMSGLFLIF